MDLSRLGRRIAAAELPALVAIAPLLLFPTPKRLLVLVVVPIVWLCRRLAGQPFVPRTPFNIALWIMLVMVAVSLQATFSVAHSLSKVSGVLLGVLLFWSIVGSMTTPARLQAGVAAFLLAGTGLGLAGLLAAPAAFSGVSLPALRELVQTLGGADLHPNPVAGCLLLFLPLQIALLAASDRRRWWLRPCPPSTAFWLIVAQVFLLCLTLGTFALMRSRGAWAGLAVAAVAFLAWRSTLTRVLAAVAAVGLVLVMANSFSAARLNRQTFSKSGATVLDSVSLRLSLWSRGIEGIRDHPVTGMGMNTFRRVMPVRYPLFPPPAYPSPDLAHAHNNFLQAALDLGIPGLISYASLWLLAFALLVEVYRRSREPGLRAIAAGLGAGLGAHFVFGLADAIPLGSKLGVFFWLALAMTVALHRTATSPARESGRE